MNGSFLIKFIVIYLVCIILYPAMYGGFGGLYMGLSISRELKSNLQLIKEIEETWREINHNRSKTVEKLNRNDELKRIFLGKNLLIATSFGNGLSFFILGIIIGIFLRKRIYFLGFVLPSIYLVWWSPPLIYINSGVITFKEGVIIIIVFQYMIHFAGIYLGHLYPSIKRML